MHFILITSPRMAKIGRGGRCCAPADPRGGRDDDQEGQVDRTRYVVCYATGWLPAHPCGACIGYKEKFGDLTIM